MADELHELTRRLYADAQRNAAKMLDENRERILDAVPDNLRDGVSLGWILAAKAIMQMADQVKPIPSHASASQNDAN